MSDIDLSELVARLGEVLVLDVRRVEEYDGTLGNMCDPRQGHIPGAVHLPIEEMVFLSDDELRERLGLADGRRGRRVLPQRVALGNRGANSQGLGYDARNYSGSWHEWSRTDLPLESSDFESPNLESPNPERPSLE